MERVLLETYEPNLIPNNGKDGKFGKVERAEVIRKNGGIEKYAISKKKDGIRLHVGLGNTVVSRALKTPNSILVVNRFHLLNQLCLDLDIVLDGEFYEHGLKFNQIQRFYSNTDVTSEKYKKELEKELEKDSKKFHKNYEGDKIDFMTQFREGLEFHMFDGIVLDRPDLLKYSERIEEIVRRLSKADDRADLAMRYFNFPKNFSINSLEELYEAYEEALEDGYEGLVLTHKDHEYKYGRNSLKQGTLLKIKDDANEYDGVILEVLEGTVVKEDAERKEGKFGRTTTTSRLKGDRVGSNKAKGFLIQYEDKGTFIVGLQGFDDEMKKELWDNKESYIGRHFKYKGMAAVKDFPRHAYFNCWRDIKGDFEND